MPVRNEERYLAEAVRHVLSQDYPGQLELVLAVGPSADRTEQIARGLAAAEPRVTVVANPTGKIPAALNAAVRSARYQVIARIDGHALLPAGYLKTAVATLTETGAADVGGVMAAEGETPFQQAVAWGMTSKAGVGSAVFHTGGGAGPTLSVYLGVYRREAIEQAGGWDEGDAACGGLGPELPHPRRRRRDLVHPRVARHLPTARERPRPWFASTTTTAAGGGSSSASTRKRPASATLRRPAAAALVAVGLVAGLAGLAGLAGGAPPGVSWLTAGFVIPATYLAGIAVAGAALTRRMPAGVRLRVPLVLGVMHMSWGGGFLASPRKLHRGRDHEPDAHVGQQPAAGEPEAVAGRE